MAKHHGNKHHGNRLHHLLDFLDVGKPLQGKDLYKAAKAEARLSIRPQAHAYQRLAKQLKAQEKFETKGLKHLGHRTTKSVRGAYHGVVQQAAANLAQQQALGNQLVARTNQSGAAYGKGLAQGQSTQLQGFLADQKAAGASGGGVAQQQLAQLVANQNQQAAAEARAQSAFAASQAGANAGLAANLGNTAALTGASAVSGIKTTILGRIADQKQQALSDISEARGKAADARAGMGSAVLQALQQLRGQEQQFKLGKMATKQRAQAAQLSARTQLKTNRQDNRTSRANNRATNRQSNRNSIRTQRHEDSRSRSQRRQDQQQQRHQHHQAVKARHKDVHAIRHLVKQQIHAHGKPNNPRQVDALEHYIRTQGSFGDNEVNLVARIVHKLLKGGGKKHHHGGGHHGNPT